MMEFKTRVAEGDRVALPPEYLRALGVQVGDEVILRLEGGEVRIFTPHQAIRRAQELVRRYIPQGRSVSDELIAERRLED